MLATIPIGLISLGDRLRGVDDEHVESLMSSIAEVGLLNPVTVYKLRVIHDHIAVDGYGIVAGLHRVEACKRLGLAEIDAHIVDLSNLQRQIAECDENLCGPKLSRAERAFFTRRRKDAYEALHPETRVGAFNQHTSARRKVCDEQNDEPADSFTTDTAKATGQSERKVQLDAERGSKIAEDVLATINGSQWDKGVVLDILKKLSHDEQRQALQRVQSGVSPSFQDAASFIRGDDKPAPKRTQTPRAPDPLNENEVSEKQVAALMAAWNKASAEAREIFLSRIDTPVFDRTRAA